MIQPDEILEKAQRLYPKAVEALLSGQEQFFPFRLPCNLKPPEDHAALIREVENLRQSSKATIGYGYSITYESRRSRSHALNNFPEAIIFESMDDLARMVRKYGEFNSLLKAIFEIRKSLPELEEWTQKNWRKLLPVLDSVHDLVLVTLWLKKNPRPGCFPREAPLAVSSKLIENNWALLSAWWDKCLSYDSIDYGCDAKDYAQRFGFKAVEQHLLIRLLDTQLKDSVKVPFDEFSVPARHLGPWIESFPELERILIVENKINLLTIPQISKAIALGGLGFGVTQLRLLGSLRNRQLIYWGDVDIEGFHALSSLRIHFPHLRSWLMDMATFEAFRQLAIAGNTTELQPPSNLTADELSVYRLIANEQLRLEQERIPQSYVNQQVTSLGS